MGNFLKDNDDLNWYLDKGIDWDAIVSATELNKASPDAFKTTAEAVAFYRDIANMVGEFSADEIAPHAAEIDREGVEHVDGEAVFPPRLDSIFKAIGALELHGMCLPRELGGLNAPMMLYFINSELMGRADVSVMAHHGFHGGIAMAMLIFSALEGSSKFDPTTGAIVDTRWKQQMAEIASGKAWGCMDITEPDAGSDMARLRAVGEQDASGKWFVTGQKIFITSGHGKYHFVIARTEKAGADDDQAAGLAGLSMFLVPTYEDLPDGTRKRHVTLDRVEEKLGHHGSVTGALTFERAPAELVGKRGEGFKWMLLLMNNARLGVGFECVGLCESALRMAKAYAAERPSMGKTIDKHEMIADMLDEMEIDIVGIRALCMFGAWHEEIGQKKGLIVRFGEGRADVDVKKLEREIVEHKNAARRVTPLLKYLGAEKAVEMARRCLQIHGGNGYMTEYGAEKLLRDALVMPIYEGTSQIQALMAMKDTLLGIMKNPQEFAKRVAQARWRAITVRDGLERRVARLQQMSLSAQRILLTRTATDKMKGLREKPVSEWRDEFFKNWNPKRDFAYAMLHAEKLIRILCDEVIAELLLKQARKDPARRALLERHLERAEPRVRFLLDQINHTGERLLETLAAEAGAADESKAAG
jgi:alkylation response protein AidB-like acyl-CoA dehydrogenase